MRKGRELPGGGEVFGGGIIIKVGKIGCGDRKPKHGEKGWLGGDGGGLGGGVEGGSTKEGC